MVVTTGVVGGPLVARQEIRTMMLDRELFTLYVLALDRMQRTDQKDTLSYFQIAGIHGRPYVAYDGATGVGNFGGYCTHSSIIFPPWHRPYLALFEQVLAKHTSDIANEYPNPADKQKYLAAAANFRIPYWDWALNADLPDVVSKQQEITLNTPQGSRRIPNPLYSYTFHPMYQDFGDGLQQERMWEAFKSTYRHPTTQDANARSNADQMERELMNNRLTIRDRTYNLLTQATSYAAFSNDGFQGPRSDPRNFESLESIHNGLHGTTGRGGHMSAVDFSAFDPVFWLHHTNCDRIFALWQALNPSSYVVPRRSEGGTFATRRGTIEDANTPLSPFRRTQGPQTQFWTSEGVRDTRTLNYTYPELVNWDKLSPATKGSRIRRDINALYGRTAPWAAMNPGLFNVNPSVPTTRAAVSSFGEQAAAPAVAAMQAPQAKVAPGVGAEAQKSIQAPLSAESIRKTMEEAAKAAQDKVPAVGASHSVGVSKKFAEPAGMVATAATALSTVASSAGHKVAAAVPAPVSEAQNTEMGIPNVNGYTEWIANINVEKYAAKTGFFVYIFLGDFNPDHKKWAEDANLVGAHYVFANNLNYTGCERCRDMAEEHKLVTGTIPLTGALGDRLGKYKLASLEPEEIIPYLQKELHWRIQTHDYRVIERTEMPSLKVSVAHMHVALPENIDEFPTWGEATKDSAITAGRPAGSNEDDD